MVDDTTVTQPQTLSNTEGQEVREKPFGNQSLQPPTAEATNPISSDEQSQIIKAQKLNQAKSILDQIAINTSNQPEDVFQCRLEQILLIKCLWETNADFIVMPINADNISQFIDADQSSMTKRRRDQSWDQNSRETQNGKRLKYSFDPDTPMLSPESESDIVDVEN